MNLPCNYFSPSVLQMNDSDSRRQATCRTRQTCLSFASCMQIRDTQCRTPGASVSELRCRHVALDKATAQTPEPHALCAFW